MYKLRSKSALHLSFMLVCITILFQNCSEVRLSAGPRSQDVPNGSSSSLLGATRGLYRISLGYNHSCAITNLNEIKCWGSNVNGELGVGSNTNKSSPSFIVGNANYISVAAGGSHTCALTDTGHVYCWGLNSSGQLGDGTLISRNTPAAVQDTSKFIQVVSGAEFSCALTDQNQVKCWGANGQGQLGIGGYGGKLFPTSQSGNERFSELSAGDAHICAMTLAGQARCWGFNYSGQLGDGTTTDRLSSVAISDGISYLNLISGYNGRTCGISQDRKLRCWGFNGNGQVGDGTHTSRTSSVLVLDTEIYQKISSGGVFHNCGITSHAKIKCWGGNDNGQLGLGGTAINVDSPMPVFISDSEDFRDVATGWEHSCAITLNGIIKCWGYNGFGQIGNGDIYQGPVGAPSRVLDSISVF